VALVGDTVALAAVEGTLRRSSSTAVGRLQLPGHFGRSQAEEKSSKLLGGTAAAGNVADVLRRHPKLVGKHDADVWPPQLQKVEAINQVSCIGDPVSPFTLLKGGPAHDECTAGHLQLFFYNLVNPQSLKLRVSPGHPLQ